jgi:hypothetical protein
MDQKKKWTNIQNAVIESLGLNVRKKTPRGWHITDCPFCGKEDKFGVKFNDQKDGKYHNQVSFNCFSGSCAEHGSEYKLLELFGKEHLVGNREFIKSTREKLDEGLNEGVSEGVNEDELANMPPPLGWSRLEYHPYLVARGWDPWQFQHYQVGITEIYYPLKDYVVILIEQDGENKGYVGRSTWDNDRMNAYNEHVKEFNKTAEKGDRKMTHPKYKNQGGVFFEKMLWGIDDVTSNTETIIIVEGPFDKTNTDKQLQLNKSEKVKCVCTFGKKISYSQMMKLIEKTDEIQNNSMKSIILMYDPEAIEDSKYYGSELVKNFSDVKLAMPVEGKDPGDMSQQEFKSVLSSMRSFIQFYTGLVGNKLDRKKYKFKG